jgi:small subunit ribosomal protein S4
VPPGVHGKKGKRRPSEFGQQLREKQKAKVMYGLLEKQFRKYVDMASAQEGDTEELLLSLLERRLDNVVFRLGLAKSRNMSRQFVGHGHVLVNAKRMTIPSYTVKVGDVITIDEKIAKNPDVIKVLEENAETLGFLEKKGPAGKLIRIPTGQDITVPFSTRQIIEYYSR